MELREYIRDVKKAVKFATDAHSGVYRNCGVLEYITHPIAVAKLVTENVESRYKKDLIIACLLHDTVEDVEGIDYRVIEDEFGIFVASLVGELTSNTKAISYMGKTDYLKYKMMCMSPWALRIKLADRVHNLSDLYTKFNGSKSDKKWAIKYGTQTRNIIEHLHETRDLTNTHMKFIGMIEKKLEPLGL